VSPPLGGYELIHSVAREAPPAVAAVAGIGRVDDEPGTEPRGRASTTDPVLAGRKILVIDDDVRNLFAITSLLERRGVVVLPAGSAKEGLETLERNPDTALVLMDMMMPEVDGFEATRQLRADHRYRGLPIIALTAKAMSGDRAQALEAGCSDFIPKPVDQDRLLEVLHRWVPVRSHA
jgi:CheY-like chemotaxis protein